MMKFATLFAVCVTLITLLSTLSPSSLSPSNLVSACNVSYCNFRGNGTNVSAAANAPDNCSCACEWPYFGYRCRYEFTRNNVSVVLDCSATYGADESLCNGSDQCYYNTATSTCESKVLAPYANNQPVTLITQSPWCYRLLPLPLEITIYGFATAAFGVGGMGFFYMMRYRNTYSIIEENGERMFNEFYDHHWLTTIYCFLLFVSSGMLAVSAYINFRDPSVCIYVIFFFAYVAIQVMVIFYPIKWVIQFFIMRFSSPEKKKIDLDTFIRPTRREIEENPQGCQMRCF